MRLATVVAAQIDRIEALSIEARDCPARSVEAVRARLLEQVSRLMQASASFDQAHDEMLRLADPDSAYEAHVALIRHGRRTCTARAPRCRECPLLSLCPYGKALHRGLTP